MNVLIETPKYSFKKYYYSEGKFRVDLRSPLPTIFNYGCLLDTKAGDGMPKDVLVLGSKISQGETVEVEEVGVAYFTDRGKQDNKIVSSKDGRFGYLDRMLVRLFMSVYALYKNFYYPVFKRKFAKCKFYGLYVEK
ncbi:inorganic diphosphatase [Candidatus Altiarchaeota archaeon]